MKIYRTQRGVVVETEDGCFPLAIDMWEALFSDPGFGSEAELTKQLETQIAGQAPVSLEQEQLLVPLGRQEVWAAGVTYYRSRDARMKESEEAGGGDFYARVYNADRPELFFKGGLSRVVGHGDQVRIRSDSKWNVPEPELTLAVHASGRIIGYTIGNDMSSRDIEGANPLYLPQAKVYDRCGALGPGILLTTEPLDPSTNISLKVTRNEQVAFSGSTDLSQLKRRPEELVAYLFRDNIFPNGCFLLTGTGIVPPPEFTLQSGDVIQITIDPIGSIINSVM